MKRELDNAITRIAESLVYDTIFGSWDGSKIIGASCGEFSANGRSARCFCRFLRSGLANQSKL